MRFMLVFCLYVSRKGSVTLSVSIFREQAQIVVRLVDLLLFFRDCLGSEQRAALSKPGKRPLIGFWFGCKCAHWLRFHDFCIISRSLKCYLIFPSLRTERQPPAEFLHVMVALPCATSLSCVQRILTHLLTDHIHALANFTSMAVHS